MLLIGTNSTFNYTNNLTFEKKTKQKQILHFQRYSLKIPSQTKSKNKTTPPLNSPLPPTHLYDFPG